MCVCTYVYILKIMEKNCHSLMITERSKTEAYKIVVCEIQSKSL